MKINFPQLKPKLVWCKEFLQGLSCIEENEIEVLLTKRILA